jgi:hypothetical protein
MSESRNEDRARSPMSSEALTTRQMIDNTRIIVRARGAFVTGPALKAAFKIIIKNWMAIFERLFFLFQIKPFTPNITRSLHKQLKCFFYDWSQVKDAGAGLKTWWRNIYGRRFRCERIWTGQIWLFISCGTATNER